MYVANGIPIVAPYGQRVVDPNGPPVSTVAIVNALSGAAATATTTGLAGMSIAGIPLTTLGVGLVAAWALWPSRRKRSQ